MMAIRSAPYYWIECDSCEARIPNTWSDTTAWSLREDAEYYAHDAEWEHTDNGLWLCRDCKHDPMPKRSDKQ